MVLFIATICICTARRLSNNHQPKEWHFQRPSRWRVRNSPMQIMLLAVKGPKFGTTCRTVNPSSDHRVFATPFPGQAFTHVIEYFVNRFPIPYHYRAATKIVPLMPMPPRRRSEGPSPQRKSGVMVLPRAAAPPVPEPNLRHRCTLLAGGSKQQKSIHHQARDTLQGDEGA